VAVAKNRVKYTEQGLRQQLISTVSAVENAYYELIYARETVKVQAKALQLAEQLFQENKKRVEVGVLAPLDEKQAQSQMATRRADLLAAQRVLESRENTLKSLITDDYAAWHDIMLQPSESLVAIKQFMNVRDSWSRGLNNRPDLLQSKLDLERAGIQLKYYRNQLLPQLDAFGSYGRSGGGAVLNDTLTQFRRENDTYYIAGIQFSMPLGNMAARARYQSGKVTVEQAVLGLKKFEQGVMVQIDEAVKQAQSSFARVDATRQAREFAEAALEAEQKKLENGKSTSFNVLSLQTDLTTARSAEIRALADYNEALTALAQAEGSTLERRKIDVKVK
jgi:outer membrane protein TolC